MALRGVAAVAVLLAASVATIVVQAGAFRADPEVTTTLPDSAGPIRESTPVQFRGVRVGTLAAVVPNEAGALLTMRLDPAQLAAIPAGVRVRLLPRTLFGNQYLDLVEGRSAPGRLTAGTHIPPDDSRPTAQLYDAYTRMYQLLDALEPAKLQVALTAMADSLRGRGERLGSMIDDAAELVGQAGPVLDNLDADLRTVAALGEDLRASAPDLLRSLDNAIALSNVVVEERADIGALLSGAVEVTSRSQRMLADNAGRTVELVRAADPISDILGANPDAASNAQAGLDAFLDGANRAFATGFFKIRAKASLESPYPYGPEDCPRYGSLSGPNCRAGGPIGPVGGPQEREAMRRLASLLPAPDGAPPGSAPPSPDLLGLLLGPMARGSEVVVP